MGDRDAALRMETRPVRGFSAQINPLEGTSLERQIGTVGNYGFWWRILVGSFFGVTPWPNPENIP